MKQAKLRHVGILVDDLEKMARFYEQLGFCRDLAANTAEQWGNNIIDLVKLTDPNGGTGIELISGHWNAHISLTVDRLPNHGTGPWKRGDDVEVVYIQDPEGNWIEFVKELI